MRRSVRCLAVVAAVLWIVPFTGCRLAEVVTIRITDFDSSEVEGVWMWRLSDETNMYERSTELHIMEVSQVGDREYLNYAIRDAEGRASLVLPAEIIRDPQNPDSVELSFFVVLFEGDGTFRASTYNEAGESPLSAELLEITGS